MSLSPPPAVVSLRTPRLLPLISLLACTIPIHTQASLSASFSSSSNTWTLENEHVIKAWSTLGPDLYFDNGALPYDSRISEA